MPEESKVNPIDEWCAVKDMMETKGWKILMSKYQKEGDDVLTKILDHTTSDKEQREYAVHELHALGRIHSVIETIKIEAENEKYKQSIQPK